MNFSGDRQRTNRLKLLPTAVILLIVAAAAAYSAYHRSWEKKVIINDVISYYAYLPALFIHDDLSLKFTEDTTRDFTRQFWPVKLDNGNYLIKTTMGMSFLYAPFFATAHAYTGIIHGDRDGFGGPYQAAIIAAALAFLLIGLWFTKKILLRYFSPLVTSITLLLIVFASNLFYYVTVESGMSHVFSFALIAIFLHHNIGWLEKPSLKKSLLIGFVIGLIALIRPTNILLVILMLLWNISSMKDIADRFRLFWKNKFLIAAMVGVAILVWIPQMLYWKAQTGSLFFNSYNEQFYFNQFHIHDALFGFRKGWFIYTPIMLFAVAGIAFMRGELKKMRAAILIFLLTIIYITFSWWAWWYGGGYGSRPMIDFYAILAIPLASLLNIPVNRKGVAFITAILISGVFIFHGGFQTLQFIHGAIHYDSMTKKAYCNSFGRLYPRPAFWLLLQRPDYENAIKGLPERIPEKPTAINVDENDFVYSENNIQPADNAEFHNLFEINIPDTAFPFSGEVLFKAADSNRFPNDLMICASLMSGENVSVNASMDVGPITSGGKETFVWKFELIPPDLNAKNISIKVFFWARKKRPFYVQNIEVVFHDLKPYCGKE